MNPKMLQACQKLGVYARGLIGRFTTIADLQSIGYSEQTAIFLLEILENCVDDHYSDISRYVPPGGGIAGKEYALDDPAQAEAL